MDDSLIVANFHTLCRLCLNKSALMVSIFGAAPDDENNLAITSKIATLCDLQMNPNDGLPTNICYKCLFKVDKCSKFRLQCIQNESRLIEMANRSNEMDSSNPSETRIKQESLQHPKQEYLVEDSVVMVVDPSMDYDSSEESENTEHIENEVAGSNAQDGEPNQFFKNIAMCQYCDRAFVTQAKCNEHEQAFHDPNLPYNCVECKLVFSERSQHIQHSKRVHGNDKPYHCSECDKCFGRRSDLRKHSIVHTGIRPYQCHYCFKNFSRNTNLSKHLRIHQSPKPHVCPLCPRSFVGSVDLQRHMLVHTGIKPFTCQKCPLTFGRRDKLIKHEIKHGIVHHELGQHAENEHESQDMVVNVNPFSNLLASLPQHTSNLNAEYDLPRVPDHISGEGSFVNHQVHKKSATKAIQNSPPKPSISNKNRPKNIKCHQCPKRFSSLDAYKTHVSISHIGSRVFNCKICFKKFSRKKEFDRHVAIHSGMKPFSCHKCDKKFTRKNNLNTHLQTHESMYVNMPCTECGATFETKDHLVAHIKSHFTDEYEEKHDPEGDQQKTDHVDNMQFQ